MLQIKKGTLTYATFKISWKINRLIYITIYNNIVFEYRMYCAKDTLQQDMTYKKQMACV